MDTPESLNTTNSKMVVWAARPGPWLQLLTVTLCPPCLPAIPKLEPGPASLRGRGWCCLSHRQGLPMSLACRSLSPPPCPVPSPLTLSNSVPTHRLSLEAFLPQDLCTRSSQYPSPVSPPEPHYFLWSLCSVTSLRCLRAAASAWRSPCPCPCSLFGFSSMQFYHLPSQSPFSSVYSGAPPKARHIPALTVSQHHNGLRKGSAPQLGGLPQPTIGRAEGTNHCQGSRYPASPGPSSVGSPVTDPGSLSPVQLTLETSVTSHALCARGVACLTPVAPV